MAVMEKVRINVGGTIFITNKDTLNTHPGTRLAELNTSCSSYNMSVNEYQFDRDPAVFACILNFYRTKELHVTQALCGNAVRNELAFWKISETVISPCCWRTLHQVDQDKEIMASLSKDNSIVFDGNEPSRCCLSLRYRIWTMMEKPKSSMAARIWNLALSFMIILQSITYCLDTQPELRTFPENGTDEYWYYIYFKKHDQNYRRTLYLFTGANIPLYLIDLVCLIFFTLELLVHLFVCPQPRRFFCSFLNWIDILTVLIGWTLLTLDEISDVFEDGWTAFNAFLVIKSIYVIRLFRVFRLMQSNSNLRIIFLALMECKKELLLLVFSVAILAVIFGSFVYFCEDTNTKFKSIPVSVWWAVVTMTTVGYGDMYPTTACGYAIGSVCAFLGVLALTLPVAVIATHFSEYYCINLWRCKATKVKPKLA